MRVIKRNARCFRLVTSLSSSFSPLSYMDRAQNRKALCPIHFCRIRGKESGGLPVRKPAAALSFVITRPAQGENIAAPQGGKYFRAARGKVLPRRKGESTSAPQGGKYFRAVRGKVLPRRKWERGATAGRRAASRTPLRGAGLTSRTPLRRPLRRHWRLCSSSRRRSFWRSRG